MKGRTEPPPGLLRQIDAIARAAFPSLATSILLVLAAVPVGLPGAVPAVALPAIFFWSVFRPAAMPPPAVFGLGLLQDLLSAAPVGAGVLVLLLAHGLATGLRRLLAGQSFLLVWLAYCGFAAGAAGLTWVLQALLGWRLPPVAPGLAQLGLTVGLYPILAWLFTRAHEALTPPESAP